MDIDEILNMEIDDRTKGIPGGTSAFKVRDIKFKKWNVTNEDLPLPLMVLKQSAMEHNAQSFRQYTKRHEVLLAPHGKTTMCPQIFKQQLDDGAWGLTAATVNQVQVYRRYGVKRIILANQLIGEQHISYIVKELNADPQFQFYCLVDSLEQLEIIFECLKRNKITRPLKILIELGFIGGRTGFRSDEEAMIAIKSINQSSDTSFAGVEAFEGVLKSSNQVTEFLDRIKVFVENLTLTDLVKEDDFIISAGGSAYFDLVVAKFKMVRFPKKLLVIIRSGCYVTHDSGTYQQALDKALAEQRDLPQKLKPALEIWSYVQSIPEPGLAILSMGKRDCPYDAGLPTVEKLFRPHFGFLECSTRFFEITAINDQHAFLKFKQEANLKVGDMIGCGISHPCTAFDKWKFIPVVNDNYDITDGYLTFF